MSALLDDLDATRPARRHAGDDARRVRPDAEGRTPGAPAATTGAGYVLCLFLGRRGERDRGGGSARRTRPGSAPVTSCLLADGPVGRPSSAATRGLITSGGSRCGTYILRRPVCAEHRKADRCDLRVVLPIKREGPVATRGLRSRQARVRSAARRCCRRSSAVRAPIRSNSARYRFISGVSPLRELQVPARLDRAAALAQPAGSAGRRGCGGCRRRCRCRRRSSQLSSSVAVALLHRLHLAQQVRELLDVEAC